MVFLACSAALAAAATKGDVSGKHLQQALAWLTSDLERRRSVLRQIEAQLAKEDVATERKKALEATRRSLLDHFGRIVVGAIINEDTLPVLVGLPLERSQSPGERR